MQDMLDMLEELNTDSQVSNQRLSFYKKSAER